MNDNLGQYFTTDNGLKEKLLSFILNNPKRILEPCIGRGDLVEYVSKKLKNVHFDMYEIDKGSMFYPLSTKTMSSMEISWINK